MDAVTGVVGGSCTDCDGFETSDCAAATCDTGYHTFVDGVGCSGTSIPCMQLYLLLTCLHLCCLLRQSLTCLLADWVCVCVLGSLC